MPSHARWVVLFGALSLLPASLRAQTLPNTAPWEMPADPAAEMVAGIGKFLDRVLAESIEKRQSKWHRDFSSAEAYAKSVEPNRARFAKIIGAVGERVAPVEMSYVATSELPAELEKNDKFTVFAVRWGVYPGVDAEGLWLEPNGEVRANMVAMADCDVTPEQFAGLAPGLKPNSQVARRLAEGGCRVLVPTLLDRSSEFSGSPLVRFTNLTHREWIYRMAFETGRHLIGYEVDKVRAAVDWFADREKRDKAKHVPVAVVGHGEGGLVALYAAAVDTRIEGAYVAGYFGPREEVWKEPVYRNVWGLLDEFGDAEIASLVAPRFLYVEPCKGPEVAGPPPPRDGRADAASGRLATVSRQRVEAELKRALALTEKLPGELPWAGLDPHAGDQSAMNETGSALSLFVDHWKLPQVVRPEPEMAPDLRRKEEPRARMKRQVQQLVDYTQGLVRTSELRRTAYWSKADTKSLEGWKKSTEPYRERFWEDVIGRLPDPSESAAPKSKRVLDEPKFKGYAVRLEVWPDVFAYGVLLLPKDLKPGERRPVVVCQHGLEGRPDELVNPKLKSVYHSYGAQLAELGYVVYAPQNPYIGRDTFRLLQRRAHPLGKSLFSVIVGQHQRTLEWLAALPMVDPERIAFYGLSYGGKTAMRVPAILPQYCLSICSADFNEWVVKCTNVDRQYSYMFTIEYDMYEFGLSEGYNYAEMAALIAPRPFQVERGHSDGVAPDEWIGYEFAKVKKLYDALGLADRVAIDYFNGPHEIHGKGTFRFLAKHLNWPRGEVEGP